MESLRKHLSRHWVPASLVAQLGKNLPASETKETRVPSLGWEDPLEKEMATPPQPDSRLENLMDRGDWWSTVHGVTELDMTECTCIANH